MNVGVRKKEHGESALSADIRHLETRIKTAFITNVLIAEWKLEKEEDVCPAIFQFSVANIPTKNDFIETLTERGGKIYGVGNIYGVSDNAVIKWLKKYEIPHHSKDLKKYLGVPV